MALTAMTPSESISAGQIGQILDRLGTALRKSGLRSDLVQQVLATKGLGDLMITEMVAVVRGQVEFKMGEIVRRVKVDRTLTPIQVIAATGRTRHAAKNVIESMPGSEGPEEVEVVFFKIDCFVGDADTAEGVYELRGLKPADPYSLAAVNKEDPAFADQKPNGTYWKDAEGRWCFITFDRWGGVRVVNVGLSVSGWDARQWFAGVRK